MAARDAGVKGVTVFHRPWNWKEKAGAGDGNRTRIISLEG